MKHATSSTLTPGQPRADALRQLLARSHAELHRQWLEGLAAPAADDDLLPPGHRVEDAMVEVGQAQARLRTGHYGLCQQCGSRIELERLIAHPAAARCWACQESNERVAASGH